MNTRELLSKETLRRRFLECAVCLQNFDEEEHEPHIFPCYHGCCFLCLKNILKDSQVTCPLCKAIHKVPDNDVKVFPKDNIRREMMDFLTQILQPAAIPIRCTNCGEQDASERCDSCQDSLCFECTAAHKRTKITSGHVLTSITQPQTSSFNDLRDPNHCEKTGHAGHLLDKYCTTESCRHLVCDICCRDIHQSHTIKSVDEIYRTQTHELRSLTGELQSRIIGFEKRKAAVEEDKVDLLKNKITARAQIEQSFESFNTLLKRRQGELEKQLDTMCREKVKSLDAQLEEMNLWDNEMLNILSLATHLLQANEISFLKLDTALKLKIKSVLDRVDSQQKSTITGLKAHMNDKSGVFEKLVNGFGAISDVDVAIQNTKVNVTDAIVGVTTQILELHLFDKFGNAIKNANVDIDVRIISGQFKTSALKAHFNAQTNEYCLSFTPTHPGEYSVSVCVLREKLNRDFHFYVKETSPHSAIGSGVSKSRMYRTKSDDRPQLQNLKAYSTENSSETTSVKDMPGAVSLADSVSSLDALQYFCSASVFSVVQKRLKTWNLVGEWEPKSDGSHDLVMYSKNGDEAKRCLQILKETVQEKAIPVRPATMVVLESDKWQGILGAIKSKYTSSEDEVAIFVDHTTNRILCYSLSTVALRDAADTIFIFLRDNDMKIIRLKFTKDNVSVFKQEGQRKMKNIQNSLSQFCVDIKVDEDVIEIRGIGIGAGKAVLEVTEALKEIMEEAAEERFSSDEDDDDEGKDTKDADDLSRFASKPLDINDITMNMSQCKVHGLYMIGDDRMVVVSEGDLTSFRVDALVNTADKRLRHDGGLAKAIVLKGGYSIQVECSEFVANNGELKEGSVFCSHPGKLSCYTIIHAVGPVWRGGSENERKKLCDTTLNILAETSSRKLSSVVIPALCSGKNKFPPQEVATCVLNTVKDFFNRNPRTILREIHLCDRDVKCIQSLLEACDQIYGVKDAIRLNRASAAYKSGEKGADVKGRIQATLLG